MGRKWTPEQREEQSKRAKELVAQGKFGGPGRGQGRPRSPRATERIAERTAEVGDEIFDRLMNIVRDGSDVNSRNAAATLLDNERQEIVRQEQQEKRIEDLRRDQLLAFVVGTLAELNESGEIDLGEIIDGEGFEVEDGRFEGGSEAPRTVEEIPATAGTAN